MKIRKRTKHLDQGGMYGIAKKKLSLAITCGIK
jgi:hypothetical protein